MHIYDKISQHIKNYCKRATFPATKATKNNLQTIINGGGKNKFISKNYPTLSSSVPHEQRENSWRSLPLTNLTLLEQTT